MLMPEEAYPSRVKYAAEVLPRLDPVIQPSEIDRAEVLDEGSCMKRVMDFIQYLVSEYRVISRSVGYQS